MESIQKIFLLPAQSPLLPAFMLPASSIVALAKIGPSLSYLFLALEIMFFMYLTGNHCLAGRAIVQLYYHPLLSAVIAIPCSGRSNLSLSPRILLINSSALSPSALRNFVASFLESCRSCRSLKSEVFLSFAFYLLSFLALPSSPSARFFCLLSLTP